MLFVDEFCGILVYIKFGADVTSQYEETNGKYIMPLTMNIHHAVADGFHLSRFFTEVQGLIDSLV